jgi:hypothetical protein
MSDQPDDAPPAAEALIAQVLQFFMADPDRLVRFFDVTGLTPDTIRTAANAPGFAASVLDYMLGMRRCSNGSWPRPGRSRKRCRARGRAWRGEGRRRKQERAQRLCAAPRTWRGGSRVGRRTCQLTL